MSLLNATQLANLRAIAERTMTTAAVLESPSTADNGAGESAVTLWNQVQNLNVCLRRGKGQMDIEKLGETAQGQSFWEVICPWNTTVQIGMRFNVSGEYYNVIGSDAQKTSPTKLIVQCERRTENGTLLA